MAIDMADKTEKTRLIFPSVPVCFMNRNEKYLHKIRTFRVRPKKRKSLQTMGVSRMDKRQKRALEKIIENPLASNRSIGIDAGYSPTNASMAVGRLKSRRKIVKALEKKGVNDDRVAEVMAEGLESENPFRPGTKDHNTILGYVKEINRVMDNYPPTRVQSESKQAIMHIHFTSQSLKNHDKFGKLRGQRATSPR